MAARKAPHENAPLPSSERILAAAQKLFADNGFGAVSVRRVTAAAGVNLAAVHYHFGSRHGLIEAVLRRTIQPINDTRLRLLDRFEAEADGVVQPERILEAFLRPVLEMNATGERRSPMQLYGRTHAESDPRIRAILIEMFETVTSRFGAALQRALPHLDHEQIAWRLHFVIGTLAHICSAPERVSVLSGGAIRPNTQNTLEQLIAFLAAGLRCDRV